LKIRQHLLRLLFLPLHREEEEKVEDGENQDDGQEAERRARGSAGLK
jgi:hypothetical protein